MFYIEFIDLIMYKCILTLVIGEHYVVRAGFSYALCLEWEDRTHVPMWIQMLTASPTQVVNSCAMKRCIIKCHVVEDFWSYRACVWPYTLFCKWNFHTPAWVNNVIGLHESCLSVTLGSVHWESSFHWGFFILRIPIGLLAWLISLEFFSHTCNNSSKVVNDVPMGLYFGNYC